MKGSTNFAAGARRIRDAATVGLRDGVEYLGEQANRTAPIEEGTLVGSGTASVDPATLTATYSYDTPYAVRQHEDTRLRHAAGRRAKWLELTWREKGQRALGYVADRIKRATR